MSRPLDICTCACVMEKVRVWLGRHSPICMYVFLNAWVGMCNCLYLGVHIHVSVASVTQSWREMGYEHFSDSTCMVPSLSKPPCAYCKNSEGLIQDQSDQFSLLTLQCLLLPCFYHFGNIYIFLFESIVDGLFSVLFPYSPCIHIVS